MPADTIARVFHAPLAVVAVLERTVERAALLGVRTTQRAVLTAAVRAVCEAPPPAPVSYPTLTVAARPARVAVPAALYPVLRATEARYFYGRTAWLIFYALTHRASRIEELLRLDLEALARLDEQLQAHDVRPNTVPLTTRAPRAPRKKP